MAMGAAALLLGLFLGFHGARRNLPMALAITAVFAIVGRIARGVSASGMLAGAVIAFILAGRDVRAFVVLLIVFLLTLAATRLGRSRKQQLHVAEPESGRSASQVMANLSIAGLVLALPDFHAGYLLALAALAEAASDTASSEIGSVFRGKTVLITNWKEVTPGTDGGISVSGTLAATLAALAVAATSRILGLASTSQAAMIAGAGVFGMLVDSVIGAAFERRGYLNNDLVNLLGTASAVGLAALIA
ncbi:MAG: DUF92 domain-containing protein [Acidobacteriia bacterium]|nr:DUF92 domain-containing protein [Terriglobia bacterium]